MIMKTILRIPTFKNKVTFGIGSTKPYEIFLNECPEVAARFNDLIEAQKA